MAGDWIKMRCELQTHPKIVRILSATKSDKFRAIGGLHAVWSVFDQHSEDGVLFGYTPETLDHVIGWGGFADAMIKVGWLSYDGAETLTLPEFADHNGQSAKRRGEDQKRKRDSRKSPQSVRNLSAEETDTDGTREEKRREEKKEEKKKSSARATRLPADWEPDAGQIAFCQTERPDLVPFDVGCRFRDYWIGKAGKDGAKLDWSATWRNWVRNERQGPNRVVGQVLPMNKQEALEARNRQIALQVSEDFMREAGA